MEQILKQGKQLIKEGVNFQIVNQFGEQKTFMRGTVIYNAQSLRTFVKIEDSIGMQLEIKVLG